MMEVDGASVVSRELKRPLLELRQLALGFDGNGDDDERIRAELVNVAERAMRQVDDLSRIGRLNEREYRLEPVAVRAVCDDCLMELSRMFGNKTCEMTVKYSNRHRLVIANKELLKSVIYNFLLDATHYASVDTKAELKVKESNRSVAVEVRDFGPALPVDVWKEMRENLIREPSDIVMRPGSSAVGLYIASRFSRFMNAEIRAVRHIDGTSFVLKLPISRQKSIWGIL